MWHWWKIEWFGWEMPSLFYQKRKESMMERCNETMDIVYIINDRVRLIDETNSWFLISFDWLIRECGGDLSV